MNFSSEIMHFKTREEWRLWLNKYGKSNDELLVAIYKKKSSIEGLRYDEAVEEAGLETLRGGLRDPVHVLEGSIDFRLEGATPDPATGNRYSLIWWGVEHVPEPPR